MARTHKQEKIIGKLCGAEFMLAQRETVEDVCCPIDIAEQSYHHWRKADGGLKIDPALRDEGAGAEKRSVETALAAPVAMMDEPAATYSASVVKSLFQGIEDEAGMRRAAYPPADDSRENVSMTNATYTKPCQVAT
jgi:hypothetical protein